MKWFENAKTVEELRQLYRKLLKEYHPDNGGNEETMKEINLEYDRLFSNLRRFSSESGECTGEEEKAGDEAFKAVLNEIVNFNMKIEIIGSWIWCSDCYAYKDRLKELGFKWAARKKCWYWHNGEYRRHHSKEVSLDEIRSKYGSRTVSRKSKQCALN